MSPELEFASRVGLFFQAEGGTRIMGLVYGWLVVCEPEHQSITEMAQALGVSKASVSTVVRQLERAAMVERAPVNAPREHHYRLREGGWSQIMNGRFARMSTGVAAAEYGLANLASDRPGVRDRLYEMHDFFRFVEQELTGELAKRFEEYRDRSRVERAAEAARHKTDSDPPRPTRSQTSPTKASRRTSQ
jgi:DNA-binding MarR family transcriptional regulator